MDDPEQESHMVEDDDFYERDTDVDDGLGFNHVICPRCYSEDTRLIEESTAWTHDTDGETLQVDISHYHCDECSYEFIDA